MFQFSEEAVKRLRLKPGKEAIIKKLIENNSDILDNKIHIQKEGLATWSLYYYCPKHSVRLNFDIDKPHEHVCPVDGEVLSGEPFDGSWWQLVNNLNAKASYELAVLWLLTEDVKYLKLSTQILRDYATYYEGYEEHGGIPYNGPGKANSQTLTESGWIAQLAYGYDIIREQLNQEQQDHIEKNLLRPCGEFLMPHRTNQLHNHEVYISAAIGIIGLLLEREDMLSYAVNSDYGLKYQLKHSVLADYLWFEGSIHYHFYALMGFMLFERFAQGTPWSNLKDNTYLEMLRAPLKMLEPDDTLTLLNDMFYNHGTFDKDSLYEYAYSIYRDEDLLSGLNLIYRNKTRDSLEAFLYGDPVLASDLYKPINTGHYFAPEGSGLTMFRGRDRRFLLMKCGPYGGEHDHYDRLGISYGAFGKRIAPDLGTTGYGAELHYDYYKNTGTHNTVMINEDNQPPVDAKVLNYEVNKDWAMVDAMVDWSQPYEMPDSFTIRDWDEDSYKDARFRRTVIWYDTYFIEIFKVNLPEPQQIDWVFHGCGKLDGLTFNESPKAYFSDKKPFRHLFRYSENTVATGFTNTWRNEGFSFDVYSCVPPSTTTHYAQGPDNPSVNTIDYMIHRYHGKEAVFAHVMSAYEGQKSIVNKVETIHKEDTLKFFIDTEEGKVTLDIRLENSGAVVNASAMS